MSWDSTELSTDVSISKKESEVISLASPLLANDAIVLCGTEDDKTFISPSYDYSQILEKGMAIKSLDSFQIVKIYDYDTPREKFYVTPNIADVTKWQGKSFEYYTQSVKIEESKLQLGLKLKKVLEKSVYAQYFDKDTNILDYIVVNDALRLVSDYHVLMLIYENLMQTQNSNYEMKFLYYSRKFDELFSDAITLLDLDIDQDGTADVKSANLTKTIFITK